MPRRAELVSAIAGSTGAERDVGREPPWWACSEQAATPLPLLGAGGACGEGRLATGTLWLRPVGARVRPSGVVPREPLDDLARHSRVDSAGRLSGAQVTARWCPQSPLRTVLRNALAHAEREELVPRNVAKLVKVKSPRYKVGQGLPVDDVKKLLQAAEGHRLYPLYVVAATLGLRRGESLGMRWQDLDLDEGTWTPDKTVQRVNGQLRLIDTKTEGSDDVLPLPEWTWLVLLEHQERQAVERAQLAEVWQDYNLVFPSEIGTPMEPRNLNRHFARLRERAGLPTVRLHDLRHTVVSLLMELGVPPHVVQAIARHSDVKITMKIYAHANLAAMREGLGRLDRKLL
jgi:integrase